jgi:hypothetical protein
VIRELALLFSKALNNKIDEKAKISRTKMMQDFFEEIRIRTNFLGILQEGEEEGWSHISQRKGEKMAEKGKRLRTFKF